MIIMKTDRSNFRVKVDLSQFYQDERKLSYVYVDKLKITNVLHLQMRIQNIFGIIRPLYLEVDGVFLPVNEDIRVIKEDEVVVVRTSFRDLNNKTSSILDSTMIVEETNGTVEESSQCEKYGSDSTDLDTSDNAKTNVSGNLNGNQIVNSSIIESENPRKKRKRTRGRKKSKNTIVSNTLPVVQQNGTAFSNNQYPKINDINKSRPKHLKFHSDESDENKKQQNGITTNSSFSKPVIRSTEITNLDTLLNLRNCQVPLTFSAQMKNRTRRSSSGTSSPLIRSSNINGTPTKMNTRTESSPTDSNIDYSKINVLDYPIIDGEFHVGDIIAFQTLRMDDDYCPVVSEYIVARVITKDHTIDSYSCEIFVGHEQLKTPAGKFTLPMDEDEKPINKRQLVLFKRTDFHQPRLIKLCVPQ